MRDEVRRWDRRIGGERCKNDTSSDIAVPLKPTQKICCVMQKPDISQASLFCLGWMSNQYVGVHTYIGVISRLLPASWERSLISDLCCFWFRFIFFPFYFHFFSIFSLISFSYAENSEGQGCGCEVIEMHLRAAMGQIASGRHRSQAGCRLLK